MFKLMNVFAVALAIGLTCPVGSAFSQEVQARLGHVFAVGSVYDQASRDFARRVEEETGGAIKISIFPSSQLGSEEGMGRDLARGTLEFAFISPAALSGVDPVLDIYYLPYIADSFEASDKVFFNPDGVLQKTLREKFDALGMNILAFYELEFRGLTNSRKPIAKVADLDGLKFRVPTSKAIESLFVAAGTQAVTLPFSELFVALQQGTVDGQDNGASLVYNARLFEAQKYMTLTNHVYGMDAIAVGKPTWDALTPEQQAIVSKVATEVAAEQIKANRQATDDYVQKIKDAGVEVLSLDDDAMREFVELGRAQWENFVPIYGKERIDALRAESAAASGN